MQDWLEELLRIHADAPALPDDTETPTLYAVTTLAGTAKMRILLGPDAQTDTTPFEHNAGLFLIRSFDQHGRHNPKEIMDAMAKAKLGCLCGHAESSSPTSGLVWSLKGSVMAELKGTVTLAVPTLRVRWDGTKEFPVEWAMPTWYQKAISLLKPAAAAINPQGHLLVVPGTGQTVATLIKLAEEEGLTRIAVRLPTADAYVARLSFPPGQETDGLATMLKRVGKRAEAQRLLPVGTWCIPAPG